MAMRSVLKGREMVTLRQLASRIETVRRSLDDSSGSHPVKLRINGVEVDVSEESFIVDDDGTIVISDSNQAPSSEMLYPTTSHSKTADQDRCAAMTPEMRKQFHAQIMQTLIDCGLNAFAFDLIAESLLKSPDPQKLDFVFPVSRNDCKRWAGVRLTVDPIAVSE